jgi:hypothetical protein
MNPQSTKGLVEWLMHPPNLMLEKVRRCPFGLVLRKLISVYSGSLQAQLANFEVMLCSHIEKMAAIRNRIAPSFPEPQHPGHTSVDMGPEISGERCVVA